MTLIHHTGDLFKVPGVGALAHGVNCRGVMGAGIATVFRDREREMYLQYRLQCDLGILTLGGVMPWLGAKDYIFNMATQDLPGPHADLSAVETAVTETLSMCARLKAPAVAMPRIGAGIGGLVWEDVLATLESCAKHVPTVDLIVVSLPGA